ncbi:hypothetical protein A9A59_1656 [Tepidiforma thermophila]|uniref:Lipoprotein LpqB beta-propeller domain-containing protein n=1 Tax=Tepidiforma thermophila (strain KCTC 52669 / CGMCC 1.13589 / G233) TaxID=2761530 RepID=A0A2A9HHZ1_TEPT2|nr:hypothetical protein A9A59_1656 [Tepidiforma thermophila]
MLAPGLRRIPGSSRTLVPFVLTVLAVVAGIGAWVASSSRPVSTDGPALPAIPASEIRAVAYLEPDPALRADHLRVRALAQGAPARIIATFPYTFTGLHARGAASPAGDRIAVLAVDGTRGSAATLSLVELDGTVRVADGGFDYLSSLAWARDGSKFAVTATAEPGAVRVIEVDPSTLRLSELARFTGAFQVVPLGYSLDGGRLYIVVVDQSGSSLWMARGGVTERVAELSPGRTRDWALSPDGSRVAFVDILSASSRTYIGKTLTIATGAVTALPSGRNQVGAAWQPGNPLPVFGGPGGSLQLEDPNPSAAWVIPHAYAPLGDYVVISTVGAGTDPSSRPEAALWIASPESRELLTDVPAASFVGWVRGE